MAIQNKVPMNPTETASWYARGAAIDMLQLCEETELDTLEARACNMGGYPSISYAGYKDGHCVFRFSLDGDEVPR